MKKTFNDDGTISIVMTEEEYAEFVKRWKTPGPDQVDKDEVDEAAIKKQNATLVRVTELLKELGIPRNVKGFEFSRTAIILVLENPDLMRSVTAALYPSVAMKFGTTGQKVERAIRHAIETGWNRARGEVKQQIFGNTISRYKLKPTNSEFIGMLVDAIKVEERK